MGYEALKKLDKRFNDWTVEAIRHDLRPSDGEKLRKIATDILRWQLADFLTIKEVHSGSSGERKIWNEAKNIVLKEGY